MTTLDYDGETCAPKPLSETLGRYLGKYFSFSDVASRFLGGWHFALIGSILGLALGIYNVWVTPPSHTITVTLLPLQSGSTDLSQFGGGGPGFGALAGALGSDGTIPKFTQFVSAMNSVGVAQAMDAKYDMVCRVSGNCDKRTKRWSKSNGFYAWVADTVANLAHLPDPDAPHTAVDLARYTIGSVLVTPDPNSRMLVLSMNSGDPKFASTYLLDLVAATNDFLKNRENVIAKKNIEFVTAQLKTNNDLSQREALIALLAQEETDLMLTAVDVPYAAAVQDGPVVDISNAAIKLIPTYLFAGFLIGAGVGIALTFRRKAFRSGRGPEQDPENPAHRSSAI